MQKQRRTKAAKLPLTEDERVALRSHRLTVSCLRSMDPVALSVTCGFPIKRAEYLVAMVQFQGLDSVGPASAQDLWDVGCRSLPDLAKRDPLELYETLCRRTGIRLDPCVEDVLRCAVAQVRFPDLPDECRNWWYWIPQRGRHHIDLKKR